MHRGAGIKCWLWLLSGDRIVSSLGNSLRTHPCTVPLSSSPLLPKQQAIYPKVSASGKPQLPSVACTHQSLPNQGQEHRLPCSTLSYSSIDSSTKRSIISGAHNLTPNPTVLTGGWRELGKHRFQQKRVVQIENSLFPSS